MILRIDTDTHEAIIKTVLADYAFADAITEELADKLKAASLPDETDRLTAEVERLRELDTAWRRLYESERSCINGMCRRICAQCENVDSIIAAQEKVQKITGKSLFDILDEIRNELEESRKGAEG